MWGYDVHLTIAWLFLASAIGNGVFAWLYWEARKDYEESLSLLHTTQNSLWESQKSRNDWNSVARMYVRFLAHTDRIQDYRRWVAQAYGSNGDVGDTHIEPTPPWEDAREPDEKLQEAIQQAKDDSMKRWANAEVEVIHDKVFRADSKGVVTT